MTGIQTVPATRATLRDAAEDDLNQYESIFLLDVDRLEDTAIERLRDYAEGGGGLVFFCGPNTNLQEYSQKLYAGGNGIFPLPLDRVAEIPLQTGPPVADIAPARHPVFSHVMGVNNSPLALVHIRQLIRPPVEWSASDENVQVLATCRGQSAMPLMVEKQLGKGRIIAVLTTAGPGWNNWCRNGTFPASLLLMQDYVSRGRVDALRRRIGQPVARNINRDSFQSEYQIVSPGAEPADRIVWQKTFPLQSVPFDSKTELVSAVESVLPGIYETWLREIPGTMQIDRLAVNVDTTESDPQLADRSSLAATVGREQTNITSWSDFQPVTQRRRSGSLVQLLLIGLLLALVAEQFLAFLNSYHPSTGYQTARSR
jgi:hypothetical protein